MPDLATPFLEGEYEMRRLPMLTALQRNIESPRYRSSHMADLDQASLKALHDNVAVFVRAADNLSAS